MTSILNSVLLMGVLMFSGISETSHSQEEGWFERAVLDKFGDATDEFYDECSLSGYYYGRSPNKTKLTGRCTHFRGDSNIYIQLLELGKRNIIYKKSFMISLKYNGDEETDIRMIPSNNTLFNKDGELFEIVSKSTTPVKVFMDLTYSPERGIISPNNAKYYFTIPITNFQN